MINCVGGNCKHCKCTPEYMGVQLGHVYVDYMFKPICELGHHVKLPADNKDFMFCWDYERRTYDRYGVEQ